MNRILLLLSLLVGSMQLAFATSQVSLKVTNPTERQIRISYELDPVTAKQRIFRVKLREDNSASFELSLPNRTELQMTYGSITVPIFIGPDDKLVITLDGHEGIESIGYSGAAAAENEFLAHYTKRFPVGKRTELGGGFLPFWVDRSVLAEAASGDVGTFISYINGSTDEKNNLIDSHKGIDAGLFKRYKTKVKYQAELQKLAFLVFNQQVMTPSEIRSTSQRLSLTSINSAKEKSLLENEDFKEYLKAYAQYLTLPNNGGHDEVNGDLLFKAIRSDVDRTWRHYLQTELVVNAFDYLGNPEFGLDHYPEMKKDGVSQVYRDRIEGAYGEVLNLSPDSMAPNIGMYYVDGRPISLTDFSGKVVYVSFWASWCKPCIAGFKKYDGVRKQLEDKGVVLLNVSIDDDEFAWKKSVAAVNPRGQNTRATNVDDVKRAYNLASIPAYYIVDKHGKIALLPEGASRNLSAAFDEIIRR
ncbi:MAG: TlpA family protein disulfide reductase [Saprospiraceae bacterium]